MTTRPVIESLGLHLLLLGVMLVTLPAHQPRPAAPATPLQAVVVDTDRVAQELARLDEVEQQAEKEREAAARALQQQREQLAREKKRLAEIERQRKAEQDALEAARRQQQEESERFEQAERERKAAEAAEQRAEQERRAAEAAEKEAERQRQAADAARQRAEQERLEQERREQQRLEAQAERRRQEMRQALEREQRQLEADEVMRYEGLIQEQVSGNWRKPLDWPLGGVCEVQVRLVPGGEVVSAEVVTGCGNAVFDRSVETAVKRASPLPVPADAALFDRHFRQFTFVFRDES